MAASRSDRKKGSAGLFSVDGKVVVITGALGQLGSALCRSMDTLGAVVIGLDRDLSKGRSRSVEYHKADISRKKDVRSAFSKIVHDHGRIDVLINNAGVSTFEPFEERPEGKIDWVMDVNLKGTFLCIQSYVDNFDKAGQDQGAIVNIASIYGMVSPDPRIYTDCKRNNSEIYGATKAGIIQMTRYFAVHLAGRKIRVNAVSPGGIFNPDAPQGEGFVKNYSDRCPMGRMAEAGDMVGAAVFLSSEAAAYVTGQNIAVDGGMSAW